MLHALDERRATVAVGDSTLTVTPEELERRWRGDYTILWRSPEGYRGPLRPGQKSRFVRWVDNRLAFLEGGEAVQRWKTFYDDRLAGAVRRFQSDQGLKPTAVVGPETVIHILNATDTDEPRLKEQGRDG